MTQGSESVLLSSVKEPSVRPAHTEFPFCSRDRFTQGGLPSYCPRV